MYLDLHEIIEMPGGRVPFECVLDPERIAFPSLVGFHGDVTARGAVQNTAGILELSADVAASMTVLCDRCAAPFEKQLASRFTVTLQADAPDGEGEDAFPLDGDGVDVSDVLESCFILGLEQKFLCRDDCRGLCPTCGKNLNDGPCECTKEIDPRMAVLGRLLDDIQEV